MKCILELSQLEIFLAFDLIQEKCPTELVVSSRIRGGVQTGKLAPDGYFWGRQIHVLRKKSVLQSA